MLLLPSVKPVYSDEFKSTLSPAERLAASYGVERRYLRYASSEILADVEEQYRIHKYSTLTVKDEHTSLVVHHDEQLKNALSLINNGMLWGDPASVIVINSPYYFFDTPQDIGAEAFLNHLICSLSHRVITRRVSNVDVNFLEMMSLDYQKGYQLKPHHLLIWGVLHPKSSDYEISRTIQFLFSFRNYTRILLTSTKDVGELLTNLRMNIQHVSYYFNFENKPLPLTKTEVIEKKKRGRKKKDSDIISANTIVSI